PAGAWSRPAAAHGGCRPPSCHETSLLQLHPGSLDAVLGLLALDPAGELYETFAEARLRNEAQLLADLRDVGEAVADVAGTRLARDLRLDLAAAHSGRQQLRDVLNRAVLAAADVEDVPGGC